MLKILLKIFLPLFLLSNSQLASAIGSNQNNLCCHYCRYSKTKASTQTKAIRIYKKCGKCPQSFCDRCIAKEEIQNLESGCPVCEKTCCCLYEKCNKGHKHCFTYRRTLERQAKNPSMLKRKYLQINDKKTVSNSDDEIFDGQFCNEKACNKQVNTNDNSASIGSYSPNLGLVNPLTQMVPKIYIQDPFIPTPCWMQPAPKKEEKSCAIEINDSETECEDQNSETEIEEEDSSKMLEEKEIAKILVGINPASYF